MPAMLPAILLSFVTASISFTITETALFRPLRDRVKEQSLLFGKLFACHYCFGHWVSFVLAALYRPRLFFAWSPLDYFLTALLIAWFAAFQCALLCLLMEKTGK